MGYQYLLSFFEENLAQSLCYSCADRQTDRQTEHQWPTAQTEHQQSRMDGGKTSVSRTRHRFSNAYSSFENGRSDLIFLNSQSMKPVRHPEGEKRSIQSREDGFWRIFDNVQNARPAVSLIYPLYLQSLHVRSWAIKLYCVSEGALTMYVLYFLVNVAEINWYWGLTIMFYLWFIVGLINHFYFSHQCHILYRFEIGFSHVYVWAMCNNRAEGIGVYWAIN